MDRMAEDDDLTPDEKAAFAALPRAERPDARLENHVVEALRAQGTIRPGGSRLVFRLALTAAAAAIGVFLIGFTLGRSSARPPTGNAGEEGAQWLLLLYSDGGFEMPLPAQEAARRAEYASWPRQLAARGVLVGGRELAADETLLMGGCGDSLVVSASARSEQRIVRGYFILRAPTLEKAIEIAKTSPHLSYGGSLTLSQIVPGMNGSEASQTARTASWSSRGHRPRIARLSGPALRPLTVSVR